MKYFISVVALLMLAGCSSEIDKCVEAGMKADRSFKPNMTKAEIDGAEYEHRIYCLRAKSGG